ncbi:MAG TPA: alkaline phosphatase D family protein, partial [Anseongella sp.]|nr:alkaline phosphatase D family protein [Anseongella sp.]
FTGYRPGADKLPGYDDKWLGYPRDYNKLMDLLEQEKIENTVFLTGDTHRAVVLALHREEKYMNYTRPHTERPLAWELYTPSITSGNDDRMPLPRLRAKEKEVFDKAVNPHLLYADMIAHGYYIARIDAGSFQADYYYANSLITRKTAERKGASLAMNAEEFVLKAS